MLIAITRAVSAALPGCELTHVARQPMDVEVARRQHGAYESVLMELGATVERLPVADDMPDATFVEDTAVVLDEVAILAAPGVASRAAEVADVERCLAAHRRLVRLPPGATLEGGDVLRVGRTLYVGRSGRTNAEGIDVLRKSAGAFGYDVVPVAVRGCLHLKTACGYLGRETIVANGDWIDCDALSGLDVLETAPGEPWGANVLLLGGVVLVATGAPHTQELLEARRFTTREVDISELQKAEAGLTCLSIVFEAAQGAEGAVPRGSAE
jgi:dimethylargininase